ncbi:hypothetical protein QBC32DRAFT_364216 [Pseudoneurospora amorphoporcata]|uniref:Uncharacterized protein n=1 Tax=Pseudoneurospora amorphoporcata TaxID=241081 RepID=A0AAN6NP78_9PEZI|nr:hypothetical protein QBC32DRAFT_364216 [Pseudoneurospora amorphoporcata]
MVNFASLSLLALGLISSQALAAPATVTATESVAATKSKAAGHERFSFAKWVDTIIADPDTALSPQEALQAYLDTVNSTTSAPAHDKRWDSQYECNYNSDKQAKASDAVICINNLAAAGQVPCTARKVTSNSGTGMSTLVYCLYGTAMLGPAGPWYDDSSKWGTCQSIAQTAGAIMDTCTQPNAMVAGIRWYDLTGTTAGHRRLQ